MDLEDELGKALCYVYMGQQTGSKGLLKGDLGLYETKVLQKADTRTTLEKLGLLLDFPSVWAYIHEMVDRQRKAAKTPIETTQVIRVEVRIEQDAIDRKIRELYPKATALEICDMIKRAEARFELMNESHFLKVTEEGEEKAREIIKLRIGEAADLPTRLSKIPKRILLFLMKYELLAMEGKYPVNPKHPPSGYIGDSYDTQKSSFNCLFGVLKNSRLNMRLIDEREKLFDALVGSGLCVTASTYFELEKKKRYETRAEWDRLNYCVPPDVLNFLSDYFRSELESFSISKELEQGHLCYHSLASLISWRINNLYYDGSASWGIEGAYDSSIHDFSIKPITEEKEIEILNELFARKSLPLSTKKKEYLGKTWIKIHNEESEKLSEVRAKILEGLCLKPMFDFLYYENQEEQMPILPIDIIIDASNVAWDAVPNAKKPGTKARFDDLSKAMEYYKKRNKRLSVWADFTLLTEIDKREDYLKALDSKEIRQSPSGVKADDIVLDLLKNNPSSKLVSNDTFKLERIKAYVAGDLRFIKEVLDKPERFIRFNIIEGEFFERPLDHN